MRKNFILFLMSVLVLTACSNNTSNETQEVEKEVTETKPVNVSNEDTIRGCDINDIKFIDNHVSDSEEVQFEDSVYYVENDSYNDTDDVEPYYTIEHDIEEILVVKSGLEEDDPDLDKLIKIFLKDTSPKFTMSELGTRTGMKKNRILRCNKRKCKNNKWFCEY